MKYLALFTFVALTSIAGSAQTSANKGVEAAYMIGPGDEITAKVLGESQFDFVATVDEDGKLEVPFTDKLIVAQCRTERELRIEVNSFLSKYLRNPQLNLRVTDRKSRPPATIDGEVVKPAQVELRRMTTLVELISFSGGVTENAGGMVQVFRTRPPLCSKPGDDSQWKSVSSDPTEAAYRMYSLASIRSGKEEANPVIYPGDVVIVQKASPVYITGEVVAPQGIYLKEGGMTLTEAIAKVGGVRQEARTKNVRILRLKPNSKEQREVLTANLDAIKKGAEKDVLLSPEDVIEIDRAKESIAQTILRFALGMGKTIVTSGANSVGYRVLY
ncbi:MAG TPA: SLBB domain-containing protein [Pyrinomonadaceae bacterium]|nr:SLBB domain-containing protein [Pyrinomonadaceae bacterium]